MSNKDVDGCEKSQLIANYEILKGVQRSLSNIQCHNNTSMVYTVIPTAAGHFLQQSIINIGHALEIMRTESTSDELVKEILAEIESDYVI
ncbi:MAG: hypothetical protein KAR42_14735 [candidate division Zixibacteria bacterium]|nr:hypothetical protein [candidate division Zixibacteria bacterium]